MDNLPEHPNKNKINMMDIFRDAIKLDGTIDGRSSYGRAIRCLTDEIDKDTEQAAAAFLKRDIAIYAVIGKAVESYLLTHPEDMITAAGLNPLIVGDLLKVQEAKRKCLNSLIELKKPKGKSSKGNKSRDLDNISFD